MGVVAHGWSLGVDALIQREEKVKKKNTQNKQTNNKPRIESCGASRKKPGKEMMKGWLPGQDRKRRA